MDVQVQIIVETEDSHGASQGHTVRTTSGNLSLCSQNDCSVECEHSRSGQRDIVSRRNICEMLVENSTDSIESAEIPLVPDLSKFTRNLVDPNNNTDHWYSEVGDDSAMAQSMAQCSHWFSSDIGSGLMDVVVDRSTGRQSTVHPASETDDESGDNSDRDPPYIPDDCDQSSDSEPTTDFSRLRHEHKIHPVDAGKIPVKPVNDCVIDEQCASMSTNASHSATMNEHSSYCGLAVTCESIQEPVDGISSEKSHSINVMMTNNTVRRHYDKVSFCYYCQTPVAKLDRHLRRKHKNESEVAAYCFEDDKSKKKNRLLKLRNLGNHVHNQYVVRGGKGDFVVIHRPKDEVDFRNYVACRYCYGYFCKKAMWSHQCPLAPCKADGTKIPRLRKASATPADSTVSDDSASFSGLLNGMRQDEVGAVASKDALILSFGRSMCKRFGGDPEQFNYIRGKMRLVAKLLIALRKSSGQLGTPLSEYLVPTKFQAVVSAAKQCARLNNTGTEYGAPSSAVKSGGVIRQLVEEKQAHALEHGDTVTADLCTQFLKLCDVKWSSEVSCVALRNLSQRKRNGVLFLPLTQDVIQLNQFLVAEANKLSEITTGSADAFFGLSQVVLAKLILFNRKRQGEASKIKVEDYQKKGKSDNTVAALALNEFEQALLRTLERMEIKGKRERTVPILLTEEMVSWIDKLMQARCAFVPAGNPYLFATASEGSHFRGSDVVRKFASQCNATSPSRLTSTNLRKSVASMAQVLSLKEHEMESLATFMGHDITVHRQFYRMPLDVMQVARISKIFLAAEQGKISHYAGKALDDIQVDPDEEVEEEEAEEVEEETEEVEASCNDSDTCGGDEKLVEPPVKQPKLVSNTPNECNISAKSNVPLIKKTRKMTERKQWTVAEKETVRSHFASYIMEKKLPGKGAIEEFLRQTKYDRKWTNIKDHIRNVYLE